MEARVAAIIAFAAQAAHAETSFGLDDALAFTHAHHPALRADAAAERAAALEVDAEHARYIPDVELFAQLDRTTSNVVPGALFPVPGLPVVSGAQRRDLTIGRWGTAAGATVTWDALGSRTWDVAIARARAEARLARHDAGADMLDLDFAVGDRFIAVLARAEVVRAARAGVDRANVFVTIVKATVGADLRAGADLSRAEAELAFAQTALVRAQAALETSRVDLAEALGDAVWRGEVLAGNFAVVPARIAPPGSPDPHLLAADDRVAVARARRDEVASAARPRLVLHAAVWGRGNGDFDSPAYGLVPDVPNWALGAAFSWPVLADRVVAPRVQAADARVHLEEARRDVLAQQLASRGARAVAIVEGAYRVAENTPAALKAARDAEQQITARYKAQLATADDVAQVQRLLVQAETEDAIARLDIWRALLVTAYASGDLAPFLATYHGAHG